MLISLICVIVALLFVVPLFLGFRMQRFGRNAIAQKFALMFLAAENDGMPPLEFARRVGFMIDIAPEDLMLIVENAQGITQPSALMIAKYLVIQAWITNKLTKIHPSTRIMQTAPNLKLEFEANARMDYWVEEFRTRNPTGKAWSDLVPPDAPTDYQIRSKELF